MINGIEDVQKIGRDNLNRAMESLGAASRGWQAIAAEAAGFSRQAYEDGAAHLERLFAAKSFDVAVQAQTNFAKASYEKAVGQAARVGELYLDLVRDAVRPFEDPAAKNGK
jgi:hypothetical protein